MTLLSEISLKRAALTAMAAFALSACATADTTSPAAADTVVEADAAVKTAEGDDVVCKRQAVVGSKFTRKICATREDWAETERNSREATELLQRSSRPVGSGN